MRSILAALLSAAALLPSFARATTSMPDPSDPAAPVPPVAVPSPTDGYRRFANDADSPGWQRLNQTVQDMPGMSGMKHGDTSNEPSGHGGPNHAMPGEMAK